MYGPITWLIATVTQTYSQNPKVRHFTVVSRFTSLLQASVRVNLNSATEAHNNGKSYTEYGVRGASWELDVWPLTSGVNFRKRMPAEPQ